MRETYTPGEAMLALGNITRRTLYNWLIAEQLIASGQRIKTLTRGDVELLADKHRRTIIDIDRDPLQEIIHLQEQVARLEARIIFVEGQLQTLTSLLGERLALEEKTGEQKSGNI